MKNVDYHNFYQECLTDNCTIKKYLPVKDYIIKIFKHYEATGQYEYGWYDKDGYSLCRISFTRDILSLFSKIMKTNAYENLDLYIDFMLKLDVWYASFPYFLELFLFRERRDNNDYWAYVNVFYNLCGDAIDNSEWINSLITNSREINMFKLFLKYYKNPDEHYLTCKEEQIREYYKNTAPEFLACFLVSGLDIDCLDKSLDELVYNHDTIIDYFHYNDNFTKEYNILELLRRYDNQKQIIK